MDTLAQVSVLPFVVFAFLLIFLVYRSYKIKLKKDARLFGALMVFVLFTIASGMGVIGHFTWGIYIGFAAFVLCIVMVALPKNKYPAEFVKTIKSIDASEPIRFRDIFSWSLMPKLERKYGVHKTLAIYLTTITGFGVGIYCLTWILIENLILINDPWYRGIPWIYSVILMIPWFIIIAFTGYRQERKIRKEVTEYPPAAPDQTSKD
ncbi:MAG: hypothetical protein LBH79_01780 [Nitrososphaerota archaeon]|jgi:preprotein translocase subunit YajC|nr:hypothetical protein [Nitrososphaerota archaeon]